MDEPRISAEQNEHARRSARFTYARRRIQKIVDAAPPFTPEQLERLALLLRPAAGGTADAA